MKIDPIKREIFDNLIPISLSLFIISSVFNVPFLLKLFFFIIVTSIFLIKENLKKNYNEYFNNFHIILFSIYCLFSFIFINPDFSFSWSPRILNILALSFLSIFIARNSASIYTKTMEYSIIFTSIILLVSVIIHWFVFESIFLSASLFFEEFSEENYATKNTLGVFICLLMPYLIFKMMKSLSVFNIISFLIFAISIFYLFSRTALVLYFTILILMTLTLNRRIFITSLLIIILTISAAFIFKITPENYNYLKGMSNQQIKIDRNYEIETVNDVFSLSSYRSKYIIKGIKGFLENPIMGKGLTTFQQNNIQRDSNQKLLRKQTSHNDYVQILFEQGLVGIFIIFYIYFIILYRLLPLRKKEILVNFKIIQFLVLIISMNLINLLDHALFWIFISLNYMSKQSSKNKITY